VHVVPVTGASDGPKPVAADLARGADRVGYSRFARRRRLGESRLAWSPLLSAFGRAARETGRLFGPPGLPVGIDSEDGQPRFSRQTIPHAR